MTARFNLTLFVEVTLSALVHSLPLPASVMVESSTSTLKRAALKSMRKSCQVLAGTGTTEPPDLRREMVNLAGADHLNSRQDSTTWRHDVDALAFEPDDHHGLCMVHRRAFRTLLRFSPEPGDCMAFFLTHESAFRTAASAKIVREDVARGVNFHLTSRDVVRQMQK